MARKKKPMGRPRVEIDIAVLRTCASLGATLAEAAAEVDVSHATLERRLAGDPEVRDAWDAGKARGRLTLRRLQWKSANDGNVAMQIWLGKQLLGQKQDPIITVQIDQGTEQRERDADDAVIELLIAEGENVVEHPKRSRGARPKRPKAART